jgi:hypothetical protein
MLNVELSQALHLAVLLPALGGMSSLTAAVISFLSWRTIRISAGAARSAAETAAYNSRHAELVRQYEHFEASALFMKSWQLELATSERSLNTDSEIALFLGRRPLRSQEVAYKLSAFSSTDPAGTIYLLPYVPSLAGEESRAKRFADLFAEHVRRYEADDVLRECFGPPYSTTAADLLGVYSLVRALSAWVVNNTDEDRAERISEITDMFRRELVLTLSRHRAFVARLFRGTPTEEAFEYFREHYGLRDDEYTRLFDDLALEAGRKGLLTDEQRDSIARIEAWLAAVPAFDPMRIRAFPRPEWVAKPMRSASSDSVLANR